MAVVKVRNSPHSRGLRLFDITDAGISIGEPTPDMQALLTGHPRPAVEAPQSPGSAE
jgi:circadian clock protein KaiC